MSAQPALTSTVQALLPLPTLESITASIDACEEAIRLALPYASEPMRAEYVWTRLRGPVAEYVSTVQGWMDFFKSKQQEGGDAVHPSTMFVLLQTITFRTVKIQQDLLPPLNATSSSSVSSQSKSSLSSQPSSSTSASFVRSLPTSMLAPGSPNALQNTLLPLLLTAWDALVERICHDVNTSGRMFGREVVFSWIRGLETLCGGEIVAPERTDDDAAGAAAGAYGEDRDRANKEKTMVLQAMQRSMQSILSRFTQEIGWVVGFAS